MSKRNPFIIIFIILLTFFILTQGIFAQPNPISENPILKEYSDKQKTNLTGEEKIRSTIEAYFKTILQSQKDNKLYDWDYLFSNSDNAKVLKRYESGKLNYILINQKDTGERITSYSYNPEYLTVNYTDNTANVSVKGTAQVTFSSSGNVIETFGGEVHNISLINQNGIWKIDFDNYFDEMKMVFPEGTNWDQQKSDFDQKKDLKFQKDKELRDSLKAKSLNDWRLKDRFDKSFDLKSYLRDQKTTSSNDAGIALTSLGTFIPLDEN